MTINDAIYNVLKAQYKKDLVNGELAILKRYGIQVEKVGGRFKVYVLNGNDLRDISLAEAYCEYRVQTYNGVIRTAHRFKTEEDRRTKFNYYGFLIKPVNNDYIRALEYRGERFVYGGNTPFLKKRYELKQARNNMVSSQNYVADLQNKIDDLRKQLDEALRYEARRRDELVETRKKLGLIK